MPKTGTRSEPEPSQTVGAANMLGIVIFIRHMPNSCHALLLHRNFLFGRELENTAITNLTDKNSTGTGSYTNCRSFSDILLRTTNKTLLYKNSKLITYH